jgi:hypothetical protein
MFVLATVFLYTFFRCSPLLACLFLLVAALGELSRWWPLELASIFDGTNYFKMTLSTPTFYAALAAILFLNFYEKKAPALLVSLAVGILFLAAGARSNALILLLAPILCMLAGSEMKFSAIKLVGLFSSGLFLSWLIFLAFVWGVQNDYVRSINTDLALAKVDDPYNIFQFLLANREDTFRPLVAALDAPVFGSGSWSTVSPEVDFRFSNPDQVEPSIGHSILGTAFLWGGAGLLTACVFIMGTFINIYMAIARKSSKYSLSASLIILTIVWHFMFSPLGFVRTGLPIVGATLLALGEIERNGIEASAGALRKFDFKKRVRAFNFRAR